MKSVVPLGYQARGADFAITVNGNDESASGHHYGGGGFDSGGFGASDADGGSFGFGGMGLTRTVETCESYRSPISRHDESQKCYGALQPSSGWSRRIRRCWCATASLCEIL